MPKKIRVSIQPFNQQNVLREIERTPRFSIPTLDAIHLRSPDHSGGVSSEGEHLSSSIL